MEVSQLSDLTRRNIREMATFLGKDFVINSTDEDLKEKFRAAHDNLLDKGGWLYEGSVVNGGAMTGFRAYGITHTGGDRIGELTPEGIAVFREIAAGLEG